MQIGKVGMSTSIRAMSGMEEEPPGKHELKAPFVELKGTEFIYGIGVLLNVKLYIIYIPKLCINLPA